MLSVEYKMASSKPKPHWKLTINQNKQRCMSCILLKQYAFTLIRYRCILTHTPDQCASSVSRMWRQGQTLSEEAIFDVSFRPVRHRCYGPWSIVFRYDLIRILHPSGQYRGSKGQMSFFGRGMGDRDGYWGTRVCVERKNHWGGRFI